VKFFVAVVAICLSHTAAADRVPYGKTVDLEARGPQLVVHHHHDWSRVAGEVRYTLAEPFGVGNDYSYVSGRAAPGPVANPTQLVVFAKDGSLVARRQVSAQSCVSRRQREAEIARHPAEQQRLHAEFAAPECLPADYLVSESVTNWVHWYDERDPAPSVIEDAGRVIAVEVNGLQHKRLRITFDPRTVRSQQPLDR
jgi:hypothetical protein